MQSDEKILIVITGPTAVGKTHVSVELASFLGVPVISADSRQFYREMNIGTAKPTEAEKRGVEHLFIGNLSIHDYYSAGRFEAEVIRYLDIYFNSHNSILLTGGSGLYIDAVCRGIDEMPGADPELRRKLKKELAHFGMEFMLERLKSFDMEYYEKMDSKNPARVLRALEIIEQTGLPISSIHRGKNKNRGFKILKIGLELPRQELYERINTRADHMIKNGLFEEVLGLYEYRHLGPLQTVGYEELFNHIDGKYDFQEAVRLIKRNTRRYAKRQLSWFKRDQSIQWIHPADIAGIKQIIQSNLV